MFILSFGQFEFVYEFRALSIFGSFKRILFFDVFSDLYSISWFLIISAIFGDFSLWRYIVGFVFEGLGVLVFYIGQICFFYKVRVISPFW